MCSSASENTASLQRPWKYEPRHVRGVRHSIMEEWIRNGGKYYVEKDSWRSIAPCKATSNWAVKILMGEDSPDTLNPHPRAAPLSLGRFYSWYLIRIFLSATHVHCLITFFVHLWGESGSVVSVTSFQETEGCDWIPPQPFLVMA